MSLVYCDCIAYNIQKKMVDCLEDTNSFLKEVGGVRLDLHKDEGWLQSTKKTVNVEDINGKKYRITIEEFCE